jgi:hypothetical protein
MLECQFHEHKQLQFPAYQTHTMECQFPEHKQLQFPAYHTHTNFIVVINAAGKLYSVPKWSELYCMSKQYNELLRNHNRLLGSMWFVDISKFKYLSTKINTNDIRVEITTEIIQERLVFNSSTFQDNWRSGHKANNFTSGFVWAWYVVSLRESYKLQIYKTV